jgi:hydrogenase nickel incorporation protein HypB
MSGASALATRFELNSQVAAANRAAFALDGVTAINLAGPAGSGKTALVEAVAHRVSGHIRLAAVVGNLAAPRDAERLCRLGVRTIPMQTDNLAAIHVRSVLAELDLARTDLVFLESGGNTLSPVEFDLGQDARVAVFSVAGGDDKAAAYPHLVAESDLVLLTKADLLPHVTFDLSAFRADVAQLNSEIPVIVTSTRTGDGIDQWLDWLSRHWSPDKAYRGTFRDPHDPMESAED